MSVLMTQIGHLINDCLLYGQGV